MVECTYLPHALCVGEVLSLSPSTSEKQLIVFVASDSDRALKGKDFWRLAFVIVSLTQNLL